MRYRHMLSRLSIIDLHLLIIYIHFLKLQSRVRHMARHLLVHYIEYMKPQH